MKKPAVLILSVLLLLSMTVPASAKYDAFKNIEVTPDVIAD